VPKVVDVELQAAGLARPVVGVTPKRKLSDLDTQIEERKVLLIC
jgi:hypothetical protein